MAGSVYVGGWIGEEAFEVGNRNREKEKHLRDTAVISVGFRGRRRRRDVVWGCPGRRGEAGPEESKGG